MKRFCFLSVCAVLCAWLSVSDAKAEVSLASPFTDHLVLQQQKPIAVWGWANPNESVTVSFNSHSGNVKADTMGKWSIYLPAMKWGGPYVMTVTGENRVEIKDIYIGEVWLCSGQSNMVMTVAREDRYWCGVKDEAKEVAAANYPLIRAMTVDVAFSDTPQDKCIGKWEVISPETVGHISALGYFFARELYGRYKIPVGIIVSAYGASTVEAWTRLEVQESNDRLMPLIETYRQKTEDYDIGHAEGRYRIALAKWEAGNSTVSESAIQSTGSSEDVSAPVAVSRKPSAPKNPHIDQHNPCVLWNAMINPLIPYTIRGFLWYQGESNGNTASIYREQMEIMIKDWRALWRQGDIPFYYVQLANRDNPEDVPAKGGPDALVREAQLQNLSVRNTGMVVAIDNADEDNPVNVHPTNKQEIGRRMALIARANIYGEQNLEYSGPIYTSAEIVGNKIYISFSHTGKGLVAKGGELKGFAVAGTDGNFVWAKAEIEGEKVVVWSDSVDAPLVVNYGFGRNPITSLYNKDGLPASPFRTNDK